MNRPINPRYCEAYTPKPGEQIHEDAVCADCGETSFDFGRFRKAEPHEDGDAEGLIYECGYCGCIQIIPPIAQPA